MDEVSNTSNPNQSNNSKIFSASHSSSNLNILFDSDCTTGEWTNGETLVLAHAVLKFGENNWTAVSNTLKDYANNMNASVENITAAIRILSSFETKVKSPPTANTESEAKTPKTGSLLEQLTSSLYTSNLPRDPSFFVPNRCAKKYYELLEEQSRPKGTLTSSPVAISHLSGLHSIISSSPCTDGNNTTGGTNNKNSNSCEIESSNSNVPESTVSIIAEKLRQTRIHELRKSIVYREELISMLKSKLNQLHSGISIEKLLIEMKASVTEFSGQSYASPNTCYNDGSMTGGISEEMKVVKRGNQKEYIKSSLISSEPIESSLSKQISAENPITVHTIQMQSEKIRNSDQNLRKRSLEDFDPLWMAAENKIGARNENERDMSSKKVLERRHSTTGIEMENIGSNSQRRTLSTKKKESKKKATKRLSQEKQSETMVAMLDSLGPPVKTENEESRSGYEREDSSDNHRGIGIPEDIVCLLLAVLKKVSAHKFSYVFKHPVSLEDAPDYDVVIKRRMDLSTLKKNLLQRKIGTVQQFHRDLLLIFHNAMVYNVKGSEIFNMALKLKKLSEKEMEPILSLVNERKTRTAFL